MGEQVTNLKFFLFTSFLHLLLHNSALLAQYGTVIFEAEKPWIISIGDTLTILSDEEIELQEGEYNFSARPQISYSWPAIFVEGKVNIIQGEATSYQLNIQNSRSNQTSALFMPITTPVKEQSINFIDADNNNYKTTFLLSAIAANWLSFYLKRKADDYYDSYQSAASLGNINDNYNKSKQFDTYSGVALGISTAALSWYIYVMLTEK